MQESENQNLRLYSISEVARLLGIGKTSLYKMMDEGKIGFITLSKQKKISQSELERFIKENTIRGVQTHKDESQELVVLNNYKPTEEIFSTMWKEFNNGKRIL